MLTRQDLQVLRRARSAELRSLLLSKHRLKVRRRQPRRASRGRFCRRRMVRWLAT